MRRENMCYWDEKNGESITLLSRIRVIRKRSANNSSLLFHRGPWHTQPSQMGMHMLAVKPVRPCCICPLPVALGSLNQANLGHIKWTIRRLPGWKLYGVQYGLCSQDLCVNSASWCIGFCMSPSSSCNIAVFVEIVMRFWIKKGGNVSLKITSSWVGFNLAFLGLYRKLFTIWTRLPVLSSSMKNKPSQVLQHFTACSAMEHAYSYKWSLHCCWFRWLRRCNPCTYQCCMWQREPWLSSKNASESRLVSQTLISHVSDRIFMLDNFLLLLQGGCCPIQHISFVELFYSNISVSLL